MNSITIAKLPFALTRLFFVGFDVYKHVAFFEGSEVKQVSWLQHGVATPKDRIT